MSIEERPGLLIVLSGPSGVGKDAAIHRLRARGGSLYYVVTATTRDRRPGEEDGKDYFFLSRPDFEEMIRQDELVEWSWVHGHLYGPPIGQVKERLGAGDDVILKIDVQGAAKVRTRSEDAIFIFLAPPSIDELVGRLRRRDTESSQEIDERVATAYREMEALSDYDYVVVNREGELDEAVDNIEAIIRAERLRVNQRVSRLERSGAGTTTPF